MSLTRKSVSRAALLLLLVVVVATMILPYRMVEGVLRNFAWVGNALDLLDTIAPGLEATHLISFAVLGFVARFSWPNRHPARVGVGVVVVAVMVEFIQIWVPGREAAVTHAVLETLGGWAGLGLAWIVSYAWGTESLPEFKHSTQWRGNHADH